MELLLPAQEIPLIATHFLIAWSVCHSVVCHIRLFCLNHWKDLDSICQGHLWGPMIHYLRWGH